MMLAWGHYFRGCAEYEQNDLAAAAADFAAVIGHRHNAAGLAFMQGSFGMAATLQAQAFYAHLALQQNRFPDALRWLSGADRSFQPIPAPNFYTPILTVAAVLIRTGDAAGLAEAEQLLRNLAAHLAATHIDRFYIDVLLLQAQLHLAREQMAPACLLVEQAVRRAQPGRLLRVLADASPALDKVLAA